MPCDRDSRGPATEPMKETTVANEDKAKGRMTEVKGDIKETAGDMTGNDRLKQEGQGDQVKGRARELKGDVKKTIDDATR